GLFSHVDNFVDQENLSFHVKISYLEIYNERVRDLLRPSLLKKNEKYTLKVREHPKEGPYVQDLSTHFINDNQQIQAILERGNEYRTTASTYMHDHSSRSHAIVTIEFTQ
ncbi:kinesin-like protein KIF16B, partial [Mizuhopecten yessoensis]